MKILICNKFMYPRGGDCNVALATSRLLESHGHEVRRFAMSYPDNLPLPESDTYASEVNFAGSIGSKLRAAARLMGMGDIRESFRKVMADFAPDVVHLHNIHSYLSPVIGEIAASMGARVVWTLHDYKLVCPAYSCRRPDGSVCTDCIGGRLMVMSRRCMKGSLTASALALAEARRWNRRRLERFTSVFICPSRFMAGCMARGGFNPTRLKVLSNFVDPGKIAGRASDGSGGYFCYIGRLSAEKGVATLLDAAAKAGVRLIVAGDGPLREGLEGRYGGCPYIRFVGHLDSAGVVRLLENATCSVIPSECNENNPLGVIESLCAGVPVIGADIGGIPELITLPGQGEAADGHIFTPGDTEALSRLLENFDATAFDRQTIAARARNRFSEETHYAGLMEAYGSKAGIP